VLGGDAMNHRGVEYAIKEAVPGKWQWTIYPKKEQQDKVARTGFASREEAEVACKKEIDSGLK
jgi:hypothetical protein